MTCPAVDGVGITANSPKISSTWRGGTAASRAERSRRVGMEAELIAWQRQANETRRIWGLQQLSERGKSAKTNNATAGKATASKATETHKQTEKLTSEACNGRKTASQRCLPIVSMEAQRKSDAQNERERQQTSHERQQISHHHQFLTETKEAQQKSNAQNERERQQTLHERQQTTHHHRFQAETRAPADRFDGNPRPELPLPTPTDLGAMSIDARLFDHPRCRAAIRASNASRWVSMNQPHVPQVYQIPREKRNVSSLFMSWQQEVFDLVLEERPHAGHAEHSRATRPPAISRVLRYVRNQKVGSDLLSRGCFNPYGLDPICSRQSLLGESFGLSSWQPACCEHLVPVDHCAAEADEASRRDHGCTAAAAEPGIDEAAGEAGGEVGADAGAQQLSASASGQTSGDAVAVGHASGPGAVPDLHAQAPDGRMAPFLERAQNASWFVFTFVRDPIATAVSAYMQVVCCSDGASIRRSSPRPQYLSMGCESPAAATLRFHSYVDGLIEARAQFGDQFYHAFPQALKVNAAGRSVAPRFDAIGSMDRLREDLKRIADTSGFAPGAPGVDAALARGHAPSHAQRNCSRIDLSEPGLLRKLCRIYAVDFTCFGFARPPECA